MLPTVCQTRSKGHAKWQNIAHTKAAKDNFRSRQFQMMSHRIGTAVREANFQTDPKLNRGLAKVIEEAQLINMPKATIEGAIKKAGNKDVAADKEILAEVMGPGRCAVLLECLVPSPGYLNTHLNNVLKKNFAVRESGLAGHFTRVGVVTVAAADGLDLEKAEDAAIECDAEEVLEDETDEGAVFRFYCDPNRVLRVRGDLAKHGLSVLEHTVVYEPKERLDMNPKVHAGAVKLLDAISEKCPFVVGVHHNIGEPREK